MQDLTDGEGREEWVTRKRMGELTNYLVNFSRKLLWKFKKWSGEGGERTPCVIAKSANESSTKEEEVGHGRFEVIRRQGFAEN